MARPRKLEYRGLPINLKFDKTNRCYIYRHPLTKKTTIFGRNQHKATTAANKLNSMLLPESDLVARVMEMGNSETLEHYIDTRFSKTHLPERKIETRTMGFYIKQLKAISQKLGKILIRDVSPKLISEFLHSFPAVYSNRFHGLLSLLFKYAVSDGLIEKNPMADIMKRKTEKQRGRLTEEHFAAIYQIAPQWLKNTMDVGVITLLRPEDIEKLSESMVFEDILEVVPGKTKKHGIRLRIKIGQKLKEVMERCRKENNPRGLFIGKSTGVMTKTFSKLRNSLPIFDSIPTRQRPTLYELRSLGIKRYENMGINSKDHAGHKTEQMREHYKKGHEDLWTEVESL